MTTASWSHGYVTDLEYESVYHNDLAPLRFHYLCLLQGIQCPSFDEPFCYLDLGSGDGFTTLVMAAANPHGRFYAVDFNPAHVVRGQQLAKAAGIDNITYLEASFAELLALELPPVDVAVAHGVITWISPEVRHELGAAVAALLKPGGLFYCSYNALPSWAAIAPLQRLLQGCAERQPRSPERLLRAVEAADQLKEAGALYFKVNPSAEKKLQSLGKKRVSYLTHEYGNAHWYPFYQIDVAQWLESAKLSYVGSVRLCDNYHRATLTEPLYHQLESYPPEWRETVKDYMTHQPFRRDLYVKGAAALTPQHYSEALAQLRLALARPLSEFVYQLELTYGRVNLDEKNYRPLIECLSEGPQTLEALRRDCGLRPEQLLEIVSMLHSSRQVHLLRQQAVDGAAAHRLNRLIVAQAEHSSELLALCSPALGAGVPLSPTELLILRCGHFDSSSVEEWIWQRLKARDQRLKRGGETLQSEAENRAEIRAIAEAFFQFQRPLLRSLGIRVDELAD